MVQLMGGCSGSDRGMRYSWQVGDLNCTRYVDCAYPKTSRKITKTLVGGTNLTVAMHDPSGMDIGTNSSTSTA